MSANNNVTPGQLMFVFLVLGVLIIFQLVLHHSETEDLQRRVGHLEQQCNSK